MDQFRLHRPVQGHLADSVAASHRAVCHALSTLFRIVLSAALLHGPKELLEVSLGQPVELDAAQAGRLRLALEELPTLLEFDLVCVDANTSPKLLDNIEREGVTLYASEM